MYLFHFLIIIKIFTSGIILVFLLGCGGGGQIVNVLAFYSDDSSLNPTRVFLKNCD